MTNEEPNRPGPGFVIKSFVIERPLGTGGMGTVFLGTDRRDGTSVAIKLLNPLLGADPSFRERFEREAHVATLLKSPYVVRVLEYGFASGYYFIVMEFVEGESVATRLERGPFDVYDALKFTSDTARALEAAGAHGIIHRDLKPSNILLSTDGTAKLADFGIARQMGAGETSVGFVGTVQYAAPEQQMGDVDYRTDIYALGATLFHMLSGRAPYSGRTNQEILRQHLQAGFPAAALAGMPDPVVDLIRRCMQKDPADRYQAASELAQAADRVRSRLRQQGWEPGDEITADPADGAAIPAAGLAADSLFEPPQGTLVHPSTPVPMRPTVVDAPGIADATSIAPRGGLRKPAAAGPAAGVGAPEPVAEGKQKRMLLIALIAAVVVLLVAGGAFAATQLGGGDNNAAAANSSPTPSASASATATSTTTATGSPSASATTSTSASDPSATTAAPTSAPTTAPTTAPTAAPTQAGAVPTPTATPPPATPTATQPPAQPSYTVSFGGTCGRGAIVAFSNIPAGTTITGNWSLNGSPIASAVPASGLSGSGSVAFPAPSGGGAGTYRFDAVAIPPGSSIGTATGQLTC